MNSWNEWSGVVSRVQIKVSFACRSCYKFAFQAIRIWHVRVWHTWPDNYEYELVYILLVQLEIIWRETVKPYRNNRFSDKYFSISCISLKKNLSMCVISCTILFYELVKRINDYCFQKFLWRFPRRNVSWSNFLHRLLLVLSLKKFLWTCLSNRTMWVHSKIFCHIKQCLSACK